MSKLLGLLIFGVVLATLKAVLIVLVIMLLLALTFAFATRPRETLVFLGVLTIYGLASAQPIACIITLGIVGVVAVMARTRRKSRGKILPTDGREHHLT